MIFRCSFCSIRMPLASTSQMGLINIIKPLSTVLSSAFDKPQQPQNFLSKFFGKAGIQNWGHWVGRKYASLCAMQPPNQFVLY